MKCSHGLPYEVKCGGCFQDAMKRLSDMKSIPKPDVETRDRFWLNCYNQSVDRNQPQKAQ